LKVNLKLFLTSSQFSSSYYFSSSNHLNSLTNLQVNSRRNFSILSKQGIFSSNSKKNRNRATHLPSQFQQKTYFRNIYFSKLFYKMKILTIPLQVFSGDNFSYLLFEDSKKQALAVDPAEPERVLKVAKENDLEITGILCTHHHGDHSAGNEPLSKSIQNLQVYGADERIPALTKKLSNEETFKFGNLSIKAYHTPCHTRGHLLYAIKNDLQTSHPPALFTGDTLFIGGCGRFFEGNAQDMYHALVEVVAALPKETLVYCGHEYTVKNLQFALTIEPENEAIKKKLEWAQDQRSKGLNTVPSTVGEELTFNPFLRVNKPSVIQAVGGGTPVEVMAKLRQKKDKFV